MTFKLIIITHVILIHSCSLKIAVLQKLGTAECFKVRQLLPGTQLNLLVVICVPMNHNVEHLM